jgi:hypothetical protein
MKTALLSMLAAIAVSFGFANKSSAQTSGISFAVSNLQYESLGTITVSTPSGNYYLAVPGNSNDTATIADTVTSITIEGQTVPRSVMAVVTMADGTLLAVLWISPCNVVIIDDKEIG